MDGERLAFDALRRIMRAADTYSRWLLREHQLTAPQLAILTEIGRREEVPLGVLAKATYMGSPTATGIVDRLEKQGLVARTRGQSDRRRVFVALTEAGRRLLETEPPLLSAQFRRRFHELSGERQRQVCETLQEVAEMMEDHPAVRAEVAQRDAGAAGLEARDGRREHAAGPDDGSEPEQEA